MTHPDDHSDPRSRVPQGGPDDELLARLSPRPQDAAPPSLAELAAWLDATEASAADDEPELAAIERRLAASGMPLDGLDAVRDEVRRHHRDPVREAERDDRRPTPPRRLVRTETPAGPARTPAGPARPRRVAAIVRWSLAAAALVVVCVLGWFAGAAVAPTTAPAPPPNEAIAERDAASAPAYETLLASATFGALDDEAWTDDQSIDLLVDLGALAGAAVPSGDASDEEVRR